MYPVLIIYTRAVEVDIQYIWIRMELHLVKSTRCK